MVGCFVCVFSFFFFNDTATTEFYTFPYTTLFRSGAPAALWAVGLANERVTMRFPIAGNLGGAWHRSEEHTSELQSQFHLVCRLLLEKKKQSQQSAAHKGFTRTVTKRFRPA